jgi:hypothetical protein
VIRINLETGSPTGYIDGPSPRDHAGGLAVGGDGMLYVADTHTLFATRPDVRSECAIPAVSARPGVTGGFAASTPDGIWFVESGSALLSSPSIRSSAGGRKR